MSFHVGLPSGPWGLCCSAEIDPAWRYSKTNKSLPELYNNNVKSLSKCLHENTVMWASWTHSTVWVGVVTFMTNWPLGCLFAPHPLWTRLFFAPYRTAERLLLSRTPLPKIHNLRKDKAWICWCIWLMAERCVNLADSPASSRFDLCQNVCSTEFTLYI